MVNQIKENELKNLIQAKCSKCSKDGKPNMWCWTLPWCKCYIKSLREELEGECKNPEDIKKYIDSLIKVDSR